MTELRRVAITTAVIAVVVASAPFVAPYHPDRPVEDPPARNAAPSATYPLGTDLYGRDVLSRVLYGARVSMVVAAVSVLISVIVGGAVGLTAGLARGATDAVLMRLVDVALSVPRVFLLLVIAALWPGLGLGPLILVLGLTSWFGTSRLVRAEVLSVGNRDYVAAARALGVPAARLAVRHVLPNVLGPILVSATLGIGQIILIEAGLSYLGLGVQEPTASLGGMIRDGQLLVQQAPWIAVAPGVVITATVLTFSALAERLERALNPGTA